MTKAGRFIGILLFALAIIGCGLFVGCEEGCSHDDIIVDEAVAATCKERGLTEGSHCAKCGKTIVEQEVIYPLEHEIVVDEGTPSTPTQPGVSEGAHCVRCGEIIIKQEQIAATGYKLTIVSNDDKYGSINGLCEQWLDPGEESTEVTAVPNLGYRFKSWSNGSTNRTLKLKIESNTIVIANFEIDTLELPVMTIYTNDANSMITKEEYINCAISVSNSTFDYCFSNIQGRIKGRGNTTWNMPKKPYKLKFNNSINLFGNGEAKTWTLIANYSDPSMARNYMAYAIGRAIGSDYCTKTQFVDLYLNGDYQGVYLVCEQTEAGNNRVEIEESLAEADTGYLLELDAYARFEGEENFDYFIVNGYAYGIKSPDQAKSSVHDEQVAYIKLFIEDCQNALDNNDYDEIDSLIDVESFFKTYIVHELFNMYDVGQSSFYLYKDKGAKLKAGPLWDFDGTAGNSPVERGFYFGYDTLWAYENGFCQNPWYKKMLDNETIRNMFVQFLKDNYLIVTREIDSIYDLLDFSYSVERNYQKWKTLGVYVWPNPQELVDINTWEGQIDYLRAWLLKSLDYMYNQYVNCQEEAFSITINNGDNYSINIYNTLDLTTPTIVLSNAWSRDLATGSLLKDGTGAIIFEVVVSEGYKVKSITIDETLKYAELLTIDEEKNIYKITGISGNITVNIEAEEDIEEPPVAVGYAITFNHDANLSVMVYPGKDYSIDGEITDSSLLEDMSGDGQVNFKVILQDGYEIENIAITGSYKNLKGPSDTGVENVYRITKAASNLEISITTRIKE